MRVSILIMAFLPPLRALTSASSARAPVSLHWASRSFLSFSRAMESPCSHLSSSARRAASTIALAAFSSESLASLVISSRSAPSWLLLIQALPPRPEFQLWPAVPTEWRDPSVEGQSIEVLYLSDFHVFLFWEYASSISLFDDLHPFVTFMMFT